MTGYQQLNPDITLNFMANRMAVDVDIDELREFACDIAGIDQWISASYKAAEVAASNSRHRQAASYYRAAEFFMPPEHPQKIVAYDNFMTNFALAFPEVAKLRSVVPYAQGELGIIDIPAEGVQKDVIVACSGFDGLIEEMYVAMLNLAANGYRIVLYEGPGQGSALRRSNLPMIYNWEIPVSNILDYLKINACTLMGLSLGGYLAPRAAAFEPRVKKLIAWGANYDLIESFRRSLGDEAFDALMGLMDQKQEDVVNQLVAAEMLSSASSRWSITHGIHTCGGKTPYDFIEWARTLNLKQVSEKINQDTLILHGASDHLVPCTQAWTQAAALTQAHSVTVRMFTDYEQAGEHCQVANGAPVIREILNWLDAIRVRDQQL